MRPFQTFITSTWRQQFQPLLRARARGMDRKEVRWLPTAVSAAHARAYRVRGMSKGLARAEAVGPESLRDQTHRERLYPLSSSRNAISFSSARTTNASRRRSVRQQSGV